MTAFRARILGMPMVAAAMASRGWRPASDTPPRRWIPGDGVTHGPGALDIVWRTSAGDLQHWAVWRTEDCHYPHTPILLPASPSGLHLLQFDHFKMGTTVRLL